MSNIAATAGCGGGGVGITRYDEAYPSAMHRVACADEARTAADGVHIMRHHDGFVAVVGFSAKVGSGERCEVVDPYGRDLFVLDCHWVFLTTLRVVVPVEVLAIKVRCLHDGADISVVSVGSFVAGPLGAKAGRDGDVGRGGVQSWVWVESAENGEVLGGEGWEHGGEFGEEGGGGLGAWVAENRPFVGVEASEDRDAEEITGAEAGDG